MVYINYSMGNQASVKRPKSPTRINTPIQFHNTHGENIQLSPCRTIARRVESFCKGIVFSNRPILINEKIYIRFVETSTNWSGVIRFGFSSIDPGEINVRPNLPKYACPDLTCKPGYWAKALAERLMTLNSVLYYYYNELGEVHFGINGVEKGLFFCGVDINGPLWSLIDVYGNSIAVEIVDPQTLENNSEIRSAPVDALLSQINSIHIDNLENSPPLRFYSSQVLSPLHFHSVHAKNIKLSCNKQVASRLDSEFSNAYVFTSRPLVPGEKIILQILNIDSLYVGGLAFGLTSCDPLTIDIDTLPADSDYLLDRPEYWVVSKDVAGAPRSKDELCFMVSERGEVHYGKNGNPTTIFMHVDHTLALWAFFDVYGSTQKIKLAGSVAAPESSFNSGRLIASDLQSVPVTHASSSSHQPSRSISLTTLQQPFSSVDSYRRISVPNPQELTSNIRTSYRVCLPPVGSSLLTQSPQGVLTVNLPPIDAPRRQIPTAQENQLNSMLGHDGVIDNSLNECVICYERSVDSVLYTCGHMCMCYDCAKLQWKGDGGGQCPICRAMIKDVIRAYRS